MDHPISIDRAGETWLSPFATAAGLWFLVGANVAALTVAPQLAIWRAMTSMPPAIAPAAAPAIAHQPAYRSSSGFASAHIIAPTIRV